MTDRADHNIWPGITSSDARALRAWLAQLGFVEGGCYLDESGSYVEHSEMLWPEGGRVMIHDVRKADDTFNGPVGVSALYVVTDHPDDVHARALALKAELVRELREEDYGSRGFTVRDAEGNSWSFGTYAGHVADAG